MRPPRARGFDQTLLFLREGYDFISNQCAKLGADIFQARLLLQRVTCMRGSAAAEMFYANDNFTRKGAMPLTVLMLLQDFGSVQMLDGPTHRHRKGMFRTIGRQQAAEVLAARFTEECRRALPRWSRQSKVVLFDEMEELLTRAGAAWAGVPMTEDEIRLRTREYSEMLTSTGSFGPRMVRALLLRQRTERWVRRVISRVRSGEIPCEPDRPLALVANHRELDGKPLTVEIAAVELINVLRAIVAVARFIVFAAKALHEHGHARKRIEAGDETFLAWFVEEVRRTAPFFPAIGGRVCKNITWKGIEFAKGQWVLLDLYGTNLDSRTWPDARTFDPDRFLQKQPTPYELIPQGAGDADTTHRCPGEMLTLELMKAAVRNLAQMNYRVPPQDLSVSHTSFPTLPASGFVMTDVTSGRRDQAQAAE
jgi:fatty-acid peroxygenase